MQYTGPTSTAQSTQEGRLKVDVGGARKRNKLVRSMVKCKKR